MATHETAKPKRKLILSREAVQVLDPALRSTLADSNPQSQGEVSCTKDPVGGSPGLPLARRA